MKKETMKTLMCLPVLIILGILVYSKGKGLYNNWQNPVMWEYENIYENYKIRFATATDCWIDWIGLEKGLNSIKNGKVFVNASFPNIGLYWQEGKYGEEIGFCQWQADVKTRVKLIED